MISIPIPTLSSLLSLLVPLSYLTILTASMATFSYLYRRRQTLHKLRLAPYFPPHTTRNIYLSLLHLSDDTKVPDSVLRAALLSRAVTDVERILVLRSRKPALSTLLQRGVVGDEIYQRLLRAEQELEAELKDVVAEANALANGWGQSIFQSASEMVQNRLLRQKLEGHVEGIEEERKQWEVRKEGVRRELMGETTKPEEGMREKAEADVTAEMKQGKKTSPLIGSDEEGVLVEAAAAGDSGASAGVGSGANSANVTPAGTPGGGGKKKKKNKK